MSLADKLESRHRESDGSEPADSQSVAPLSTLSSDTAAHSPAKAQSNGLANGHTKAPKVVLQNLPQLNTPALGKGVTPATWPAAQAVPAVRSSPRMSAPSGVITTTTSVETQVPKSVLLEVVQSTAKATGVHIEITKGAVGDTTFMLKGRPEAVEKAKPLLKSSLAPRIKISVRIPSAARSALIGARGSNLRRVSEESHCKIDLTSVSSAWSLDLTEVQIEGTSDSVAAARATVLGTIDKNRTLSTFRNIPPLLVQFMAAHSEFGSYVVPKVAKIVLQGTYDDVLPSMSSVDDLINAWTVEYVLHPLSHASNELTRQMVPEDLVFEKHGVIITPEGALYGPPGKLNDASRDVESYLSSLSHAKLDIAQAHNRNEAHARVLTRYLAATKTISQIADQYGVKITEPAQGESVYDIFGENSATVEARKSLVSIVNSHGPTSMAVVRGMKIPLVRAKALEVAAGLTGSIRAIVGPSDELYIVFEDLGYDFAPTTDEVKTAVNQAVGAFDEIVKLSRKAISKTLKVDEDIKYIITPQGGEAKALYHEVIGSRDDVHCEIVGSSAILSGLRDPVRNAIASIPEIIALSKQHAVRASFTQELQFDPNLLRNLIGRGGAQIQSYRDQYDVSVEADDNGRVIIQGIEDQAKAAAKAIAELQRRLRDEQTERLAIPVQYHVKLIGPKGKHVKRLSEKYDVSIKFPKRGSTGTSDDGSDFSRAETPESDGDIIVIRGPSKGVAAVKREFTDLVAYEKSQSYSENLKISAKLMPRIVGRQGIAINTIKHETGAQIDIDKEADGNGDVAVVVTGEQKRVVQAIKLISKAAEELQDFTVRSIDIDPQYHRLLTGPGNSIRRQIVAEAGGDVEPLNPRTLLIPPSHTKSSTIRMSGPAKIVNAMEAIIMKIIEEEKRRSQAVTTVDIPQLQHRLLIGPQGRQKRAVEEQFNVQITIPRGQDSDTISVRGERKDDVQAAVKHLQDLANVEQATLTIPSPIWTSRLKRKVSDKFGVKVEGKYFTANLPKPDSGFVLSTFDTVPKSQLKLTGKSQEDVSKAVAFLSDLMNQSDTVGYLWLDGQQKVRKAVGVGGQNVNSVRSSTQCIVEIPDDSQNAPIIIVGPKDKVQEAHEALLKFCA